MEEDDIYLILEQYNSIFVTYEKTLGIYSIKDISEAVYTMGDQEGTLTIENDVTSMKTKLVLKRFGGTFGTLRFDEKDKMKILGCAPYWDYKPTNAIHAVSPGVHTIDKILNLSASKKIIQRVMLFMVLW